MNYPSLNKLKFSRYVFSLLLVTSSIFTASGATMGNLGWDATTAYQLEAVKAGVELNLYGKDAENVQAFVEAERAVVAERLKAPDLSARQRSALTTKYNALQNLRTMASVLSQSPTRRALDVEHKRLDTELRATVSVLQREIRADTRKFEAGEIALNEVKRKEAYLRLFQSVLSEPQKLKTTIAFRGLAKRAGFASTIMGLLSVFSANNLEAATNTYIPEEQQDDDGELSEEMTESDLDKIFEL